MESDDTGGLRRQPIKKWHPYPRSMRPVRHSTAMRSAEMCAAPGSSPSGMCSTGSMATAVNCASCEVVWIWSLLPGSTRSCPQFARHQTSPYSARSHGSSSSREGRSQGLPLWGRPGSCAYPAAHLLIENPRAVSSS